MLAGGNMDTGRKIASVRAPSRSDVEIEFEPDDRIGDAECPQHVGVVLPTTPTAAPATSTHAARAGCRPAIDESATMRTDARRSDVTIACTASTASATSTARASATRRES